MYCKKCGKQIPTDSEFCTYCGSRLKAPKMEDILIDEDDLDGDSYIAVNSPAVTPDENENKEADLQENLSEANGDLQPQKEQQKTEDKDTPKFESFLEDENEEKSSNGKLMWIIAGLVALIAVIVCAIYFSSSRGKKTPEPTLSEQTNANAQQVTTAKQTETQAEDQKNGYFERTYSDGSKYSGNFKDGVWDGEGVYTSATGIVYKGTFTKGAITGKGTIRYKNGDEYQGDYKNAQRDGQGVLFYNDGSKYKGAFLVDKKSGYGEIWYVNGDYFAGMFVNDVKQGYGEYTYESGAIYKGHYQSDLPHGEGQMNYSEKEFYRGNFKEGKKSGHGEYHLESGDIISGNWTSDDITGHFTYYDAQKDEIEANVYFEQGERKNK